MFKVRKFAKRCWLAVVQAVVLALLVLSSLGAYAETLPNAVINDVLDAQVRHYQPGDLIQLPMRKGNYVMLLGWESPIWYNGEVEWFQTAPIRNYTTITVQVPRKIEDGDYQFVEIDAIGDPTVITNWKWIKEIKVRIQRCDGFKACY